MHNRTCGHCYDDSCLTPKWRRLSCLPLTVYTVTHLCELHRNTLKHHLVRKVCNPTIWIQQGSAYVVCLDQRSSPQVSEPGVGGRAQAVDGAVGCGLEGMGGTM